MSVSLLVGDTETFAKVPRLSDNLFREYADKNGYQDFKVLKKGIDKLYGYNRYVVVFRKD